MGRYRVKKLTNSNTVSSFELESRDAAQAFAQVEKDRRCNDAEIWKDDKKVGCVHRRGSKGAPFWIIDDGDLGMK